MEMRAHRLRSETPVASSLLYHWQKNVLVLVTDKRSGNSASIYWRCHLPLPATTWQYHNLLIGSDELVCADRECPLG